MNYWRIHDQPPVLATMDHRAVLVAAWAAREQGLFGAAPPLLLRLDAHPDFGEKPRPWAHERSQLTDLDSVHAVVNDQRHDDGGWVVSALQFGLARDVVSLFVHDYHRFPGDDDSYTDHTGTEHELATFPGIAAMQRAAESSRRLGRIFGSAGYCPEAGWSPEGRALWVDIDLDFATRRSASDEVSVWTAEDWAREFDAPHAAFLAGALSRAALVTIATEPEFCGGHGAVGEIADALKRVFAPHGAWFGKL
jgi:hypothetical protein